MIGRAMRLWVLLLTVLALVARGPAEADGAQGGGAGVAQARPRPPEPGADLWMSETASPFFHPVLAPPPLPTALLSAAGLVGGGAAAEPEPQRRGPAVRKEDFGLLSHAHALAQVHVGRCTWLAQGGGRREGDEKHVGRVEKRGDGMGVADGKRDTLPVLPQHS